MVDAMSWDDFQTRFWAECAQAIEAQQLAPELLDPHQTNETVAEITAKPRERVYMVPQYAADEEMKKESYQDIL